MKSILAGVLAGVLLLFPGMGIAGDPSLDAIMTRLEARYNTPGVCADFHQESTLKALEVTDTATGRIFIKRPGRMRWEYDKPSPQVIVTDGVTLWIYRPEDNQVMTGKATDFFGEGKGAAFLSDIKAIRAHFDISLANGGTDTCVHLKLVPRTPMDDLQAVLLTVSRDRHAILEVTTRNIYGDETRLTFTDTRFDLELNDRLFSFTPPPEAEVLSLDE